MHQFAQLLLLYSPSIVFGLLFLWDFHKEPRQFRNAIWFLLFAMTLSAVLLLQFGRRWFLLPVVVIVILAPVVSVVFLVVNGIIVIRHEGASLSTLLPLLLALAIIGYVLLFPVLNTFKAPAWAISLAGLITLEGTWFFFSFLALLLYSWLYRKLPRRRRYDYIIIHGAGLKGDQPTPLLRGRLDRALELWERQGRRAMLIVSGGKGPDEAVSESQAMKQYLVEVRHVPEDKILQESRSTTTLENLRYSKEIIDARTPLTEEEVGPRRFKWRRESETGRVALVTSDYHVFRASEYASRVGLKADGIGCHTKGYYWPAAFIREFIAVTRSHLWPYAVILVLWAIGMIPQLLH